MTGERASESLSLSPFERQVKQALRLYDDPDRLGKESPLSSTYILGRALRDRPQPITPRTRGEVLCAVIRSAAARLWHGPLPSSRYEMLDAIAAVRRDPDDPRYAYVVLELRCFNTYVRPNRTSDIWEQPQFLPGSKSQHYRDFDAAIKRLAGLLLDSLRPTLRPERPRPPEALYGYAGKLAQLHDLLAAPQTLILSGPGGAGKTSLAAMALAQLERPAFWYTLRPGFNDGISSLLFALGAFLHEQGAPGLWQYLVTTNGQIGDLNLAAGLLRQDLAALTARPPILCLDDLEHLAAGDLALLAPAYTQLLDLIENLRGSATLLLISQRPLPSADRQITLSGLEIADIAQLWGAAGRPIATDEAAQLHAYTGGNPRLLTLMLALGDEAGDAIGTYDLAARSLLPAFQRLWRRLTPDERRALQRLAVYQGYAPEDVLPEPTLITLDRLRLIERDGVGGVVVLPALLPIIRDDLSPELRTTLHDEAAVVRLERGEYTAAAYHFTQSGQDNRAVQAWFPQRQQALARGEADIARPIFAGIARQRLGPAERKAIDIIRAELRQLAGQHEEGLRELEQVDWRDESEAGAHLWMLRGELERALGYPDRALVSYGEGMRVTASLLGRLAALHQRRGMQFQRRRETQASWQEVHRAEFDLEVLRGLLREQEGAYDAALDAYHRARALADQLDDDALRAQAERQLAALHGRREQLAEAVTHASQSIAIYERIGDRVNLEKMRSNLSAIYVQARQFSAAIEVGVPAYAFFTAVRDPYFAAVTAANLAEASAVIGSLDDAERYASAVLGLGQPFAAPYARFTLGQVALARHNPAEAITQYAAAMQLAHQNDDPYLVVYAQRAIGQAHLEAADLDAAQRHLAEALAQFQHLAIPSEIAETEQLLAEVAAQRVGRAAHMGQ